MSALPITSRLSERQSEAWHFLENDLECEEVFFGGAAGPGKTWLGCLWQMRRRVQHKGTRGFIGRDEYVQLRDSTMETFFLVWNEFGRYNPFGVTGSFSKGDKIFEFSNGSKIYFRHLSYDPADPDYHRLGSTFYTDAFVDELPECDEKAIDIINSRIRYELINGVPKFLGCGNPANNWVKWRYIKDFEGNLVTLKPYQRFVPAVLLDNPDPEFRRIYQKQLEKLPFYDQQRLLYGDWDAVPRTGGEAFYSFDPDLNTGRVDFIPETPVVHSSFDQNVIPYITLLCCQCVYKEDGTLQIRIFKEYCLKHPDSTTEIVCTRFLVDFGSKISQVFIYGDASGNKRDTRAAQSDYKIAENVLKSKWGNRSNRVQTSNPEVRKRVLFLCSIFEGRIAGVEIVIDKGCYNLIQDLMMIKSDANGGKVKEKATKDGVTFEKYGHTSDALEYMVTSLCPSQFKNFEKLI